MRFLLLSLGVAQLVVCLPNGALKSWRSIGKMSETETSWFLPEGDDFPWPIDKDLEEGPNVVKIRYGPHTLKANSEEELFLTKMKKPCDDCWITAFQGGLEYANGTIANADSGAWLHHMVSRVQIWGLTSN
jgi:hypothetical protein